MSKADLISAGRLGTVFHDAVALRLAARGQLLTLAQAGVPDTLDPAGRRILERWLKTACELPLLRDHVLEDTETELELALEATIAQAAFFLAGFETIPQGIEEAGGI